MKSLATTLALGLFAAAPAYAQYPIFAAQCAGGVNQGGYNIDTDTEGHLWVNGHRVRLEALGQDTWEGTYHGATFFIAKSSSRGLEVGFNDRQGRASDCVITAQ